MRLFRGPDKVVPCSMVSSSIRAPIANGIVYDPHHRGCNPSRSTGLHTMPAASAPNSHGSPSSRGVPTGGRYPTRRLGHPMKSRVTRSKNRLLIGRPGRRWHPCSESDSGRPVAASSDGPGLGRGSRPLTTEPKQGVSPRPSGVPRSGAGPTTLEGSASRRTRPLATGTDVAVRCVRNRQ